MRKFWPLIVLLGAVVIFFRPFVFGGKLPIPADTIVGMYHPFRDFYAPDYPNGIPFKNFLITDPVRQQYPWRELAINVIKRGELPLWNPYNFTGTPLLANFQAATFYPLNTLFLLMPFNLAWAILIFSAPLLAGIFLYAYLINLKLNKVASLLGGLAFSFSGFFIAWLEWGTILHVGLWLPLILLSIDKIFFTMIHHRIIVNRWAGVFIVALISSFFAGHLQTFFYVGIVSVIYVLARWWQFGRSKKILLLFVIHYLLFIILTAIQWFPTLQLINLSAREIDIDWQKPGWFLPWQNLVQFLAPDFFGNPATLNYWGIWNYGEFIGYVGILPLIMAILALFSRLDKKTLFFGTLFFLSLSFALPTPWAKLPYQWQIPFLTTTQPTRLLFLVVFSLSILAALGMDFLLKQLPKAKNLGAILFLLGIVFVGLWAYIAFAPRFFPGVEWLANLPVSKRNLILPTALFGVSAFLLGALLVKRVPKLLVLGGLLVIVTLDLLRFGQKFTPFTKKEWLYPQTEVMDFLQSQPKPFRIMATDRRIFPPNFSSIYHLETVDGYDPLYLARYGELMAASERGKPDISPPFGFNRIITPQNYNSKIMDLANIKYTLSLQDLSSPKFKKVFQEGQTRVYENLAVLPRAFFVEQVEPVEDKETAIQTMWKADTNLREKAVIELLNRSNLSNLSNLSNILSIGKITIVSYSENRVVLATENTGDGFLVLTDSFYPTWRATIDKRETVIYRTDYNFRGIFVPKGKHQVEFYTTGFYGYFYRDP